MPEFKKDILNELKREINKEMQSVAERFESQIREVRNKNSYRINAIALQR
jgi:hypothetical protein